MKRSFIFPILLIALLVLFMPGGGYAGEKKHNASRHRKLTASSGTVALRKNIARLLADSLYGNCFIGCRIVDATTGTVIYEMNSDREFHPASVLKLFTAAAACSLLPPDYRFVTSFGTTGDTAGGMLRGNLVVTGGGDPLATAADLDSAAAALVKSGIRSIGGDIIGDVSLFDSLSWGHGWMWDDEPDPDEAFISPLSVEHNAINVAVTPDSIPGHPARVILTPVTGYCPIRNISVTTRDTASNPLVVTRSPGSGTIVISGTIHPSDTGQNFDLSVSTPAVYFLQLLKERIMSAGCTVAGSVYPGKANGVRPLFSFSRSIDTSLWHMLKRSDNLAAENTLRILSHQKFAAPAGAEGGIAAVKEYCAGLGIDTALLRMADGSGVSWYNEVTPRTITSLLESQYRSGKSFRRFYDALPVAGVDGTLQHRMHGTATQGNAHAKTGSLTGCSSLAGYVTTADSVLVGFAMMMNHYPGDVKELRKLQDRIVETLAAARLKK
jgi:serine-type D-Ala-D-Ala carboxypeptidase/endopeptidase (penicillin-binding protein 4)